MEVVLVFEDQSLTRFANNAVHQNVAERNATLIVRLLKGKRIGLAVSNRWDGNGLDKLMSQARTNAQASPQDPDYPGLPGPAEYKQVEAFDPHTAGCSPEACSCRDPLSESTRACPKPCRRGTRGRR